MVFVHLSHVRPLHSLAQSRQQCRPLVLYVHLGRISRPQSPRGSGISCINGPPAAVFAHRTYKALADKVSGKGARGFEVSCERITHLPGEGKNPSTDRTSAVMSALPQQVAISRTERGWIVVTRNSNVRSR